MVKFQKLKVGLALLSKKLKEIVEMMQKLKQLGLRVVLPLIHSQIRVKLIQQRLIIKI